MIKLFSEEEFIKSKVSPIKLMRFLTLDRGLEEQMRFLVHAAAADGKVTLLEMLYKLGADLEMVGNNGMTPAHFAAKNGHTAVLKKLHELGCNLYIPTPDNITPLSLAVENDKQEATEFLTSIMRPDDWFAGEKLRFSKFN